MRRLTVLLCTAGSLSWTLPVAAQPRIQGRTIATFTTEEVSDPTVSPDGRWLVYTRLASNSDYRLMIQPIAGGVSRELPLGRGVHFSTRFAPQGDRLLFFSSLPRRASSEDQNYLMAAPFDTRTGSLTGQARQVTLEPVRLETRLKPAISPDGKSVAYVSCCASPQLRVVPITGGNARTLAGEADARGGLVPGWLGWTADSRFVTYHQREGDKSTYSKVRANGGNPEVIAQLNGGFGFITPDLRHFVSVMSAVRGVAGSGLLVKTLDGREVGRVKVPMEADLSFSADGKYLVGRDENGTATIKLASLSGGPIRQLGKGDSYEWPAGWSSDSRSVQFTAMENGKQVIISKDVDGRELSRFGDPGTSEWIGIQDGWSVWSEGPDDTHTGARVIARNLTTGVQKQLASDVVSDRVCCAPAGPGGMYYGITGAEFYVRQKRGDRLQVRAMKVSGESRLLADLPQKSLVEVPKFSVFENRVVYREAVGDSVLLRMTSAPARPPVTIATFPAAARFGEHQWSHDGRQLSVYRNDQPQKLFVYRFDASASVQGPPREFTLPFDYFYDTFWLPDGSGMTMIAQTKAGGAAEVALVKFADPSNPILLSKADPGNKWGHALSPDGKYVAYPVEKQFGSSIYLVEVAELLKRAAQQK